MNPLNQITSSSMTLSALQTLLDPVYAGISHNHDGDYAAIDSNGHLVIDAASVSDVTTSKQFIVSDGATQRAYIAHDATKSRFTILSPNNSQVLIFDVSNSGAVLSASNGWSFYAYGGNNGFINAVTGFEVLSAGNTFYLRSGADSIRLQVQGVSGQSLPLQVWADSVGATLASVGPTGAIKAPNNTGSADPTTSNFASGMGGWWKNTTNGEIRYWHNDGGTMKKSAALI